jgi:DNA-binding CsgD family transcriptional regulator
MFGLTDAEARVADGLRLGKPDEDIASVLGVKVSTVRTHIKMILAKTETRTKAEAAHLLTLLSA